MPGPLLMMTLLAGVPDLAELERMNARFVPTDLKVDLSHLPVSERKALFHLVQAAREMDGLFLDQSWSGNAALAKSLELDKSPLGRARLKAFLLNKGPWSRLDENRAFIPGVPPKPAQASFYPADATKAEIEAWVKTLSEPARAEAMGFFTVIRRETSGKLTVVAYRNEHLKQLKTVAEHLHRAGVLSQEPSLKKFLLLRAEALVTDRYQDSDIAWMQLDSAIEPTLGPYEVYEDEWFNAKAAYEAFITVRDEAESQKLAKLSGHLQEVEDALPVPAAARNPKVSPAAPIVVVNSLFSSGDGNRGVQTAAYNLPNDEQVIRQHGSKRVMLKNVQQAKFDLVLRPLAKVVMAQADAQQLSFQGFFTHILMHELVHGLGPHDRVRERLQDAYSPIEEAKADIGGLFAMQLLLERGVLEAKLSMGLHQTFVASLVRSLRFGLTEAHAKGVAIQLNWLLDAGAVRVAPDGKLQVVEDKMKAGVKNLSAELLRIEAAGDRSAAVQLLANLGSIRPPVQKLLDAAAHLPVDIAPRFVTADSLRE